MGVFLYVKSEREGQNGWVSVVYVKGRERGTDWVGVCAGYVRRKRERDSYGGCVCTLPERKGERNRDGV